MKTDQTSQLALSPLLARMKPYRVPAHPAPVELRLASNEGPRLPEALTRFDDASGESIRCYPAAADLEAEIAERMGIDSERVLLTAGADDGLLRAIRLVAAPGRDIVLPSPTFEMIERTIRTLGAEVQQVPWWRSDLPVEAMLEALGPRSAAVVLVSPNNPTGSAVTATEMERLLEGLGDRLLIVDQAYGDFATTDLTPQLLQRPNVIVLRTLSKAFGLAGLRIGIAIGAAELVEWMRSIGHPYPVAGPSLAIALRVLADEGRWRQDYLSRVQWERQELVSLLCRLGQRPMPSEANFVLCEYEDAGWVADGLAGLGVSVRRFPGRPQLGGCLRITCPGSEEGWKKLSQSLEAVLAPQALLFDMDGVLADVRRSFRRAIRLTADHFGVAVTQEDIELAKAAGDANNDWLLTWRLVQARRPEVGFEAVKERFESLYQGKGVEDGLWRDEKPLLSVGELSRLAERLPLAIVTGRPRRDAERFLETFGLGHLFPVVISMEDGPAKPDPAPVRAALEALEVERAWLVGDTPDDMQAARAAGVVPIGFSAAPLSSASRTSLLQAGASRVLSDTRDLCDLLASAGEKGVE